MDTSKIYRCQPFKITEPCLCREKRIAYRKSKKRKKAKNQTKFTPGRPLAYPTLQPELENIQIQLATFCVKYDTQLSAQTKSILNSFHKKYIYYAIDDILYLLNQKPKEKQKILEFLYSSMLSLHNNLFINFFDIWIDIVYINEIPNDNRFFTEDQNYTTCITLKLCYLNKPPIKKPEPIW